MSQVALSIGKFQNESIRLAVVLPLDIPGGACGKLCTMSVLAITQAIEVINNKTDGFFDSLLPNTLLEYEFYDTMGDQKKGAVLGGTILADAFGGKGADIIVGAGFSSISVILSTILNSFDLPMVSPLSTSTSLSSYKNFMRVIPADDVVTLGMVRFAKYVVGWNFACIISGTDEFSMNGGNNLEEASRKEGIEILQREYFLSGATDMNIATDRMVLTGSKLFFYFGFSDKIPVFLRSLYYSLVAYDSLDSGFSVIFPEIYLSPKESYKSYFQKRNELHVYEKMFSGTFAASVYGNGSFMPKFLKMYNEKLSEFDFCYDKIINASQCSNCGDGIVNPLTNKSLFSSSIKNGRKTCLAANSDDRVDYSTPFGFDAVLFVASVYHELRYPSNSSNLSPSKSFSSIALDPSFHAAGATGDIRLSANGDRAPDGIGMNIWNNVVSNDTKETLAHVGFFDVGSKILRTCDQASVAALHGEGLTCLPYLTFNTKSNAPPKKLDQSLFSFQLGITTSTLVSNGTAMVVDQNGAVGTLAMLIAVDHINNKTDGILDHLLPHIPIKYTWINVKNDDNLAVTAAIKMAELPISALIGDFSSDMSIEIQNIVKHRKIAQISPTAASPQLSDKEKYPYFMRTAVDEDFLALRIIEFMKKTMNWNSAGIVSDTSSYSSAYRSSILKHAKNAALKISLDVILEDELIRYGDMLTAMRLNTRLLIIVLPKRRLKDFLSIINKIVKSEENMNERNFCFVFAESIFDIKSLPSIVNGSFAISLKPKNNITSVFNDYMKSAFLRTDACVNSDKDGRCGCLSESEKRVFLTQDKSENTRSCAFPNDYDSDRSYSAVYAYDSILAAATAYHELIVEDNVDAVTPKRLFQKLHDSTFRVNGFSGKFGFDQAGNRLSVSHENFNFSVYNSILTPNGDDIIWKERGILDLDGNFEFCRDDNDCDKFFYSTMNGKKPVSELQDCKTSDDCEGNGICQNNECICTHGRIGSNCQQLLFGSGVQFPTNIDGSQRCFKYLKPTPVVDYPTIRVCFNNWESQILASELFLIITKELFGWPVVAHYFHDDEQNAHDNLDLLANGTCHIFLEAWDTNEHHDESMNRHVLENSSKKIFFSADMGYTGRNGLYINSKSIRKGFPTDLYAAYRKLEIIEAMQNVSLDRLVKPLNCSGGQDLCDSKTGKYISKICQDTECGTLFAGSTNYAKNQIQRVIESLGLKLEVKWLGDNALKTEVLKYLDSTTPYLFYWWKPDPFVVTEKITRLILPPFDEKIFESTGGCDFREDTLGKFATSSLPVSVLKFIEKFKIESDAMEFLVSKTLHSKQTRWENCCAFIKNQSNLEKMWALLPDDEIEKNLVRITYRRNNHMSVILTKITQELLQKQLKMNVTTIPSSGDLEARDKISKRHADIYIGMKYVTGQTLFSEKEFLQFFNFNIGFHVQLGLYFYVPESMTSLVSLVNHYLYSDELVKWMPPLGTYVADAEKCRLWWCIRGDKDGGHFIPPQCKSNKNVTCGEILISAGYQNLPHVSILAQIIENLNLPFALTYINQSTFDTALQNSKYIILYLSEQDILVTKDKNRFTLPAFHTTCMSTARTTNAYNKRFLGGYNCDFPVENVYITTSKRILQKPEVLYSFLDEFHISYSDIYAMVKELQLNNSALNHISRTWIQQNSNNWRKWIKGCDHLEGHYGVLGKCKPCPPGTYSPKGSNMCELCPRKTYTPRSGSYACISCPSKTTTTIIGANELKQCMCMQGKGNADIGCLPCTKNGLCFMGKVYVSNGHWRFQQHPDNIFQCPYSPSCLGVSPDKLWSIDVTKNETDKSAIKCAPNYHGNLCNSCSEGYAKSIGGSCEVCGPYATTVVVLSLIALGISILFFVAYRASKGPVVKVTIMEKVLEELCKELQVDSVYVFISELVHKSRQFPTFLVESHDQNSEDFDDLLKIIKKATSNHKNSRIKRRKTKISDMFSWKIRHLHKSKTHLQSSTLNVNRLFEIKNVLEKQHVAQIRDPLRLSKYTSFFRQETKEVLAVPILSDFKVTLGCLIFRRNQLNTAGLSQKIIDKFFATNRDLIVSQSQDKSAIITKIFFSHIQIIASAQFLVLPWTRSSYSLFQSIWDISSLASTIFTSNTCMLSNLCKNISHVYCKAVVLVILPVFFIMMIYAYVYIYLYVCRKAHAKRGGG